MKMFTNISRTRYNRREPTEIKAVSKEPLCVVCENLSRGSGMMVNEIISKFHGLSQGLLPLCSVECFWKMVKRINRKSGFAARVIFNEKEDFVNAKALQK